MRQIDADAVFPWYVETFSEKNIGERAIQPNEIRFSMNDIRDNLDNIPTIDAEPVRQMETANLTVPIIIDRKDIEESLAQLVKALTQQWIPCSERMPETTDPVIITWVNHKPEWYYEHIKDKPFVATGHYYNGRWYWFSDVCQDYLNEYGDCKVNRIDSAVEVIAWMPNPEPYHGTGAKMDGGEGDAT